MATNLQLNYSIGATIQNGTDQQIVNVIINKLAWKEVSTTDDPPPHGHGLGGHSRKVSGLSGHAGGSNQRLRRYHSAVPRWTHVMICEASVDVRDGYTRIPGRTQLAYHDSTVVIAPVMVNGVLKRTETYAVVFVSSQAQGPGQAITWKRAYLQLSAVAYSP